MVEQAWREFSRAVLGPGLEASVTQRREMRKAFYAGATILFYGILARLEPGTDATEKDLAFMDAIQAEFKEMESAGDEFWERVL
jgi:hypothetical protein